MSRQGRQPNEALRSVLQEAGMSYAALARRVREVAAENGDDTVRTSSAAVAYWVAGTPPRTTTTRYVAEALSRRLGRLVTPADIGLPSPEDAGGPGLAADPVESLAHLGRADVDRRRFLSTTAYSVSALALPLSPGTAEAAQRARRADAGGRIGAAEIATVREVTKVFTRADERLGGDTGRSAVVEYLATDVAAYCRGTFADDGVRRGMFGAAAELAYLAGWKAHDAGRAGLAQRYYLHSFQLAEEADPRAHAGYVLRILAHQAFDNGHNTHCVDLADAALNRVRRRVDKETESLFWLTLARAHAAEGNRAGALSAITTAERLMDTAKTDQPPGWASLGGPPEARLANQTAKALTALRDVKAAEEQYRRSARCWNPATHPRIHALTLADLGHAQLWQGRMDSACGTWTTALRGLRGVNSARAREAVADMRRSLTVFRNRGSAEATRLDEHAAAWQSANT
ncbi:hypothetical protein KBZ10_02795 [Streptomyces sp. F63]|uniref:hypothetical protein n=1 Tax=Streptomyces sp. F63 TaxID=2824887 RepID=UPI001B368622|nr:hypothetical protein [Streptomyces sp. F63]MBQ0983477.1 hypothetical protein [Streptomyces sp. F63]